MKYLKKEEKKKGKVLTAVLCAAGLLAAAFGGFMIAAALKDRGQAPKEPRPSETVQQGQTVAPTTEPAAAPTESAPEQTIPGVAEYQELVVESDYGTFLLSGEWHGGMRAQITEGTVYTISLYGQIGNQQEQHLFDVCFGDETGDILGYLRTDDGAYVAVKIRMSDFTPGEGWLITEEQEFYGMQNEVNSIMDQMVLYDAEEIPDSEVGPDAYTRIETPYLAIDFPGTWQDRIRTQVSGSVTVTVSFYGTCTGMEECHLYDLILGGTGENAVGSYILEDGTEIWVEIANMSDGPDGSWSDEAAQELSAMLDSINDVLYALDGTGNFRFG